MPDLTRDERRQRDRDAYTLHQGGATYAAIGDLYGLSRQRIAQLVERERKRRQRQAKKDKGPSAGPPKESAVLRTDPFPVPKRIGAGT